MSMENEMTEYDALLQEAAAPNEELARLRDEIKLQLHLAKAEARSQWEELEKKWVLLQSRLTTVKVARDQSAQEVGSALKLLMGELGEGYRRLKEAFSRL